ncbi:MAG: hypothetical protein FJ291_03780 [Planctomycetes bacterium]|nr:hypothetical protein [Planctomycetota bacterium]
MIRRDILFTLLAIVVVPYVGWSGEGADPFPPLPANARYTGPDWPVMQKVVQEMLDGGAAAIAAVADKLPEPGTAPDFQPRYTLCAATAFVAAPGREAQRRLYIDSLAAALEKPRQKEVQKFVILQLQLVGDDKAAAAIGKFLLGEQELNEVAALALSQIGGAAAEVLRAALPQAKPPSARANIIRALGEVRDAKALPLLTPALGDAERDVRLSVGYALAKIGDPASAGPLLKAAGVESPLERGELHAACFLLGQRLAEAGKAADAARLHLEIWKNRPDVHLRAAAIEALARSAEPSASEAVAEALKSDVPRIRSTATAALAAAAPVESLKRWFDSIGGTPQDGRALFLTVLGRRGDARAMPLVMAALKDEAASVRDAAAAAAGAIGDPEAVPALLDMLKGAKGKGSGARAALERMAGKAPDARIAAALAAAEPALKGELLAVLAARGAREQLPAVVAAADDKAPAVRAEAIRALGALGDARQLSLLLERLSAGSDAERAAADGALVAISRRAPDPKGVATELAKRLDGAATPLKASLLRALGETASPTALEPLCRALKDSEAAVQEAALRALAAWPDDAPCDDLLAAARTAKAEALHVLALRGVARMVQASKRAPDERLKTAQAAMAAARRPEEKKLILGAMGAIHSPAALEQVLGYLQEAPLAEEAGAAAVSLGRALRNDQPAAIRAAMEKVLAACKNQGTVGDAKKVLAALRKE